MIKFELLKNTGKTAVWEVRTTSNGMPIGEIKWYSKWRRYCFFPYSVTLYDSTCLMKIAVFMD